MHIKFANQLQKKKKRNSKFKETGDSRYIYQHELDKACFQILIKYCLVKHLILRKLLNSMDIKEVLLHCFISFLIKNSGDAVKNENMQNRELAEASHKPISTIFIKRKAYSLFIDNIWGTDLADMRWISKFNKVIRLLLCVIDIFSNCTWVIPLKDKKETTITKAFQKILDESNRNLNKIWVDKSSDF